jgi:osmotically-inducible protein OsmY
MGVAASLHFGEAASNWNIIIRRSDSMSAMHLVKLTGILVLGSAGFSAFAQSAASGRAQAAAPLASEASDAGADHATGSKAADRTLAKRVRHALAKSGMVMIDMKVQAKDGVVFLIGSVPSSALVAQAEHVAANVSGVSSVTNRLTVRIDPRTFNGTGAGTGVPAQPVASARKPE